jgi:predicted MFS family arabinose efflux permease
MVLFLISLCGLASSVAYRSMDPLVTSLARDFSVPVATAALVSSAYALPFALGQPVLGPMGDVFGKGKLLAICLFVLTATLIIGAFAPNFESMLAVRFIGGLAGGGTMPVAMALIGDKFPPEKRQVAIARFLAVTLIGQIFASTLAGMLAVTIGWRGFFWLGACITLTAAIGALWKLQEPQKVFSQAFGVGSAFRRYGIVFANPKSWLCFGTVFFEAIAIFGVTPYVSEILESNHLGGPPEAGFVIAGIGVGGLIYSLILGWLMRFFTRVSFMAWGGAIGAGGILHPARLRLRDAPQFRSDRSVVARAHRPRLGLFDARLLFLHGAGVGARDLRLRPASSGPVADADRQWRAARRGRAWRGLSLLAP